MDYGDETISRESGAAARSARDHSSRGVARQDRRRRENENGDQLAKPRNRGISPGRKLAETDFRGFAVLPSSRLSFGSAPPPSPSPPPPRAPVSFGNRCHFRSSGLSLVRSAPVRIFYYPRDLPKSRRGREREREREREKPAVNSRGMEFPRLAEPFERSIAEPPRGLFFVALPDLTFRAGKIHHVRNSQSPLEVPYAGRRSQSV